MRLQGHEQLHQAGHTRSESVLSMCILGSSWEMLWISDGRTSSVDRLLSDFWMPEAACSQAGLQLMRPEITHRALSAASHSHS